MAIALLCRRASGFFRPVARLSRTSRRNDLESRRGPLGEFYPRRLFISIMPASQKDLIPEGEFEICRFSGQEIRKICHRDEWFFCVIDVVSAITGSSQPRRYWSDLKAKLVGQEGFNELLAKIEQLEMQAKDGKHYSTDAANTETIFRIIQSMPTPRAEPFKQWLAKVGYERIQEHQNPSIAIKRAIVDYQMQGRSMDWIEARLRTIFSRKELTDEWRARGITEGLQFAILTDDISMGTFGKTTKGHKLIKSLKPNHNLRDNMTPIELILTMLGETSTKQIAQSKDAQGFAQNQRAAQAGGAIAGGARKQLELQTGKRILSPHNNLDVLPPSKDLHTFPPELEASVEKSFRGKRRKANPGSRG